MRVYRIEHHATGFGPWHDTDAPGEHGNTLRETYGEDAADTYDRTRVHGPSCYEGPTATDDCRLEGWRDSGYRCGTVSIEQATQWFACREGRQAMAERGMVGRIYEVPEHHYALGQWQVLFSAAKARHVGDWDIVDLGEKPCQQCELTL